MKTFQNGFGACNGFTAFLAATRFNPNLTSEELNGKTRLRYGYFRGQRAYGRVEDLNRLKHDDEISGVEQRLPLL